MRNLRISAAGLALAMVATSPAAAMLTVDATVTGFASQQLLTWTVVRPGGNVVQPNSLTTRFTAQVNSGNYPYPLLGGTTPGSFVAFCVEPMELLGLNTAVNYQVVPLSRAASGIGGIGVTKANQLRELFGRFAPNGGFGTMTALNTVAFQLAVWEIVMETPGNPLNVLATSSNKGNFYVGRTQATSSAFLSANNWLGQLDGTGPMAKGLVVLQKGTMGVQGSGTQDLLAFAGVPEPASWALLIAGFGLTGASLRRRRRALAAAA